MVGFSQAPPAGLSSAGWGLGYGFWGGLVWWGKEWVDPQPDGAGKGGDRCDGRKRSTTTC